MEHDFISPDVEKQLGRVSWRLGLSADELNDLLQEMVLVGLQGGDPVRSLFSVRRPRGSSLTISLDEMTAEEEPRINDVHSYESDLYERMILGEEVQKQIAELPRRERRVCYLLMHYSPNRVARILHWQPEKLRRVLDRLKTIFAKFSDSM